MPTHILPENTQLLFNFSTATEENFKDPYLALPIWLVATDLLKQGAKTILLLIENHRNRKTGQCNPRLQTLAREAKLSVRAVSGALGELRGVGLVKSHRTGRANHYECAPRSRWRAILNSKECPVREEASFQSEPPVSINEPTPSEHTTEESSRQDSSGVMEDTSAHGCREASSSPPPHQASHETPPGAGDTSGASCSERTTLPDRHEPDLFPMFFEAFVRAGVPLNARDHRLSRALFQRYSRDEQERIGKWALHQIVTVWRTPEFTPTPASALRSEGWTRVAQDRNVPKPMTREQRFAREFERRRAERMRYCA